MLNLTVLTGNLKGGLTFAQHAISSRSQLPILLNFLILAKDGHLIISATDLEIGMQIKIPAKIEGEGKVSVLAKTFLDLISNIDQEKITLEQKEKTLTLRALRLKTTFPVISASEFPKLFESKGTKTGEFKKEELDRQIQRIVFAAASDLGRPALSGVLVRKGSGGDLALVATDGYRLSLAQNLSVYSIKETDDLNLLIPARVIKEVAGMKQEDQNVELFVSKENNQVLFEYGGTTIVGRLIEAEYPDYQKIIPDDFSSQAVIDRGEAQAAVRACSVFAREAANIVKMSVGKDKIVFSASASSVGENEVEVEAKISGEENEIAFNTRYLLEFFSSIDEERVVFEMTGPLNPGVFKLEKDKTYLHLIMPIRVAE
ncbi:MAG: DNA polymerase III subunit beta [Candidatus Levybacteria bacterium]|nr:DNA polymerase III subunit beta [Candidatus Levybacteria bacterium]